MTTDTKPLSDKERAKALTMGQPAKDEKPEPKSAPKAADKADEKKEETDGEDA